MGPEPMRYAPGPYTGADAHTVTGDAAGGRLVTHTVYIPGQKRTR